MNDSHPEPFELPEIVYEKPLSGEFEEVLFGSDHGNTLWVRFSDKYEISEWIGKFGCGGSTASCVTRAIVPDKFFISAGGFAYLIDAMTRKLINQYCEHDIQDAAYDGEKNLLIVADWTHLRWIQVGKEIFKKRIAADGIRDLRKEGRVLSGLGVVGYGGEEQRFKFDLDEHKILSWEKLPKTPIKTKHWWKFW
jgi:hypothetical protein